MSVLADWQTEMRRPGWAIDEIWNGDLGAVVGRVRLFRLPRGRLLLSDFDLHENEGDSEGQRLETGCCYSYFSVLCYAMLCYALLYYASAQASSPFSAGCRLRVHVHYTYRTLVASPPTVHSHCFCIYRRLQHTVACLGVYAFLGIASETLDKRETRRPSIRNNKMHYTSAK